MAGCGTWAEEIVVPWQGAIKVDADVPWEVGALIGCGITTGVGAAINTAKVRPGLDGRGHRLRRRRPVGDPGRPRLRRAARSSPIDPLESKHAMAKKVGATHAVTPDQVPDAH